MSSVDEDQSSQPSTGDGDGPKDLKSVEDLTAKMNGLSEESAGSASESAGEPKENGLSNHKPKSSSSSSSHKHGDGHHHSSSSKSGSSDKHHSSSSSKHRDGSSSSSSKHKDGSSSSKHKDGSSSSSSKHRDGHSSSSSSKHKEGSSSSSSKHGSSSSSSKHKDGSSSSSRDKEKSSSSSSSKPKDGSSSDKHSSSSSSKHKDGSSSSSSKHRDGHSSSSSSKHKDGSSSSKEKSSSSSSDKHKDRAKESSSSKDKDRESSSKDKDKHKSSSSSKHREGEKSKSSTDTDKHKSSSSSKGGDGDKEKHSSSSSSKHKEVKAEVPIKKEPETNSVANDVNHSAVDMEASPVEVKQEVPSSPIKVEKRESPAKKPVIKSEDESDDEDDKPLSVRKKISRPAKRPKEESDYEDEVKEEAGDDEEDEDSDVPLSVRNKAKKLKLDKKVAKKPAPAKKAAAEVKPATTPPAKKKAAKNKKGVKEETEDEPVKKKKKGGEEEQDVWRWWEEERQDNGVKWTYLEHKGPLFAPEYEPLPKNVRFYYDGKPMELTPATEEVATFYGRMLDHDYTTKDVFNNNFMKDWRKVMSPEEKAKITDLKKCNFHEILDHFKKTTEEKKNRSKEEKQRLKKENEEIAKEYGFCIIDHHKEKIGNFKIEPPGLFRGRGDHPKQGMLKKRVNPEDVIINCSKDSKVPEPPAGRKWKEVRHDNTVTWLASWTENIQGATKYVMLNAASRLKGEKDWQKYETARKLHKCVDKIRAQYQEDWKSKEMRVRQRAVALYFIDKLALRAGNEKDEGESADTVGCCSLRVEHITLHNEKDGKQYVVEFDFLGKDSIRYQNSIPVEKRVYKNLQLFMENKSDGDDLFDRLNTTILNKHLQDLMEGLTAKVFRTFNASKTLSEQLELLTNPDDTVAAKMLSYNRANRAVAILCNHQRAVPKTFEKSMENLMKKIDSKKDEIKAVKKDIKGIKADYKREKSVKTKTMYEKKKKQLGKLEEQLVKLEVQATDKDENKEIALGTSKLNYLDPRISVAWCKKFGVPIEKVYNRTQRDKFRWAIDMATEHFKF